MHILDEEKSAFDGRIGRREQLTSHRSKKTRERFKRAVADLVRAVQDFAQPGTGSEIEAEELADKMGVQDSIIRERGRFGRPGQELDNTAFELLPGGGRRV